MNARPSLRLPDACERIALCGGPYSNFAAVEAFLGRTRGLPRFCLGDLGGFGPHPDRTLDLVRDAGVTCLQGNYDRAVGFDERDCGCGYVDAEDRRTAQVSFDYTAAKTGAHHKAWLRTLPPQLVLEWRGARLLLVHGSPDEVNGFVWESETDDATLDGWLERERVDGICATHSGVPWIRRTARGFWCNVGVLGRPAHEHATRVGYALADFPRTADAPAPSLVPLEYDVAPVAAAMRAEGLPEAFARSLETGLWTTCSAILPPRERVPADRYAPHPSPEVRDARHAAAAQVD
ncbi:MAG TPA: metallophosphoesterase [Casimicrobiaceae bacterium]|nr:metallophosphoesterase [Casimicrobiaceae bacterium]